jgi:hypothetical protein
MCARRGTRKLLVDLNDRPDVGFGAFTSFSIPAVYCFTFAVRQNRTHIEALIFCSKDDRDHHRVNHSLLAGCLMATLPFPQPDYENSRAVRTRDLRENSSTRVLENAAAEILQTMPKVSRPSHREKKSLNDNDICVAEQEIFELAVRFSKLSSKIRGNRAQIRTDPQQAVTRTAKGRRLSP